MMEDTLLLYALSVSSLSYCYFGALCKFICKFIYGRSFYIHVLKRLVIGDALMDFCLGLCFNITGILCSYNTV